MPVEPTFIALTLLAYLSLAVAAGWLMFFPSAREFLFTSLRRGRQRLLSTCGQGFSLFGRRLLDASNQSRTALRQGAVSVYRHRIWLGAGMLVVLAPLGLVLIFQQEIRVGGFEEIESRGDDVVTALLEGEQLVPPPALPPEVFVTSEVERIRPTLGLANRDWQLLDLEFRQRLLAVLKSMRDAGYEVVLIEGYRSPQREDYLASLGPHVTQVRAFQSYHQYGLAADCAFFRDGRLIIDERNPWAMQGYQLYGKTAEKLGLTWGGRWKMMDFGHLELRRPGVLGRQ